MRRKVPVGLLAAPLAWLLVAYLGALAMIFATAFFTTAFFTADSFTGAVVRDFSLENYREVLTPTYIGIIVRTVLIASLVTVLCEAFLTSVKAGIGATALAFVLGALLSLAWPATSSARLRSTCSSSCPSRCPASSPAWRCSR